MAEKLKKRTVAGVSELPGVPLDRSLPGARPGRILAETDIPQQLLDRFDAYLNSFGKKRVTLRQQRGADGNIVYTKV